MGDEKKQDPDKKQGQDEKDEKYVPPPKPGVEKEMKDDGPANRPGPAKPPDVERRDRR